MSLNFYLYKKDVKNFIKRNAAKLIVFLIVVTLSIILAVRNVLMITNVCDYFEEKNSSLYAFVKGEGSMLTLAFVSILEMLLIALLLILCTYNDFTTLLYFVLIGIKSYVSFKKVFVILLYYGVKALPLFIFYVISLLALLAVMTSHAVCMMNSHLRIKYGMAEAKCVVKQCSIFFLMYSVIFVITLLLMAIGVIFI